jgi:ABC-type lipoprotein export system ATPase subunit
LVTHELYIAEKAKRIISLKDGEIIEDTLSSHFNHSRVLRGIK